MSGYSGYSKSNNAVNAESRGLVTATEAARRLGVTTGAIKAILYASEWHHSSKFFNQVDYYDLAEITPEELTELKEFSAKYKNSEITVEFGDVKWLEWSGTRAHPKAIERTFEGEITHKGQFYIFTLPSGEVIRKKVGGNGTYFHRKRI